MGSRPGGGLPYCLSRRETVAMHKKTPGSEGSRECGKDIGCGGLIAPRVQLLNAQISFGSSCEGLRAPQLSPHSYYRKPPSKAAGRRVLEESPLGALQPKPAFLACVGSPELFSSIRLFKVTVRAARKLGPVYRQPAPNQFRCDIAAIRQETLCDHPII